MPRYKLTVEYDGTGLAGWQRQKHMPSVQQHLEEAIKKFSGEKINLFVAGRTDAGVHALAQVCHFDMKRKMKGDDVRKAINHFLKGLKIVVIKAEEVDKSFNARMGAKKRHYLYRILNRKSPAAVDSERVWHIRKKLDIKAMNKAAQVLIGKHDFTSFRDAECQAKSPIKTLDKIVVKKKGQEVHITVSAQSFLHHMVRNITGTLVDIGKGKTEPEDMKKILKAKDRKAAGPTAPAYGLYFVKVDY